MLYVNVKQRASERANPPQGKFVEVDGVRLRYTEKGEGPALVLLHGNGLLATDFELSGVLAAAARSYRVITFDRPGFGHSERPGNNSWTPEAQALLFYQALHQLGVERPIVLGHSWGTLVALAMALDFPRYVRAITLVSGYSYPSACPDVVALSVPAIPGLGHVLRYTIAPVLGRIFGRAWSGTCSRRSRFPSAFAPFPSGWRCARRNWAPARPKPA